MMKRTARGFELIAHSLRRMKSFFSIKPRSRRITFSFIPRCVIQHETTATGTMRVIPGARTLVHADLLSRFESTG